MSASRESREPTGRTMEKGVCRCEATVASTILDGYACGNLECWRTAEVQASFDAFVKDLVAKRDDGVPPALEPGMAR